MCLHWYVKTSSLTNPSATAYLGTHHIAGPQRLCRLQHPPQPHASNWCQIHRNVGEVLICHLCSKSKLRVVMGTLWMALLYQNQPYCLKRKWVKVFIEVLPNMKYKILIYSSNLNYSKEGMFSDLIGREIWCLVVK